jgi:hypothetical protein
MAGGDSKVALRYLAQFMTQPWTGTSMNTQQCTSPVGASARDWPDARMRELPGRTRAWRERLWVFLGANGLVVIFELFGSQVHAEVALVAGRSLLPG